MLVKLGWSGVLLVSSLFVAAHAQAQDSNSRARKHANSDTTLARKPRITEADARRTALAAVPGGRVRSHELERENGRLIYSYDIKAAGQPGIEEINVDAMTGTIVAHEHEDAATEAKERKKAARSKSRP
jgi:uncharacterized membrane protein YkoI